MAGKQGNKYKYEIVADQILEEIRDGRWKVGEKLPSEGQLMEIYDVSRASLREALKRLSTLGIVDVVQGDGTYVRRFEAASYMKPLFSLLSVNENSIEQIYEVRILVESGLAQLAAEGRTTENIRRLSYLLSRMDEAVAFNDFAEYSKYDEKFHRYIYSISNNPLLITMTDMFRDITRTYTQRLNQNPKVVERSIADHRQIFYAIEEQETEYAFVCMKRHLEYSRKQLLKMGI